MQQRNFHVTDIHCDGCRSTIHDALGDVEGVEQVNADIDTNAVLVVYEEQRIGADRIAALLGQAGFPVQSVAADDSSTDGDDEHAQKRQDGGKSAGGRYGLLAVAVGAIGLAGYAGYVLYPRFDLPALEGAALLGLAAAAGIASFFSPCSFPLLLGLLGRHTAARASDDRRAARPMVFGGALALGAAAFMLLLGAAIGIGGQALFADVTFASTPGIILRSTVGLILILLGLVQLGMLPSPMHAVEWLSAPITRRHARLRREKPVAGFALYGFGYVLAGFG